MEVTNQTNPNECGVCVINSLVRHFYHKSNKLNILQDAHITEEGLSIFNFEYLAQQYGIFVETFQLTWNEFNNLKNNEYMVCPIKKGSGLHYVIIQKYKNVIDVYDSANGKYQTSLNNFSENFVGIVMLVSKNNSKINIEHLPKLDLWNSLDWKYLLISLFMQIVIILLGAVTADYFNIMINHAIVNKSITNGITIMLIFGIFFLLEGLMHYLLTLYSAKHFKINFHFLCRQLIHALNNKNRTFFNKVDSNYFYLVDTAMQSITVFIVMEVSMLCSNCVLVIVIVGIVTLINPWFLLVVFVSIIFAIVFNAIQYYYRKHMTKVGLENQRINNSISHRYIDYFKTQHNSILQKELNQQLEHNYVEFQRIYLMQAKFNSGFNFFEGITHNFIYLILIMIGCYLIVEYQNINIGQLTFLISLISMMSGGFNGICEFVTKRIEYTQMSEIYKNFITLGNYDDKGKTILDNIKTVAFNGKKLLSGKTYAYQTQLMNSLVLEENTQNLLINDVQITNFDLQSYLGKLFVINYDSKIERSWIYQHFDQQNKIFLQTIRKFNINLTSVNALNIYEQTLINILGVMLVKNKLIILNDCLRYVSHNNLLWVKQVVVPYLRENNFLLIFN